MFWVSDIFVIRYINNNLKGGFEELIFKFYYVICYNNIFKRCDYNVSIRLCEVFNGCKVN